MLKSISYYLITLVTFIIAGCESDLKKVKEIELKQNGELETTKQAEIIYSDSTYVKAVLKAPILNHYKTNTMVQ